MARRVAARAVVLAGLLLVVVAVYALVVLGIGHVPTSGQWTLIGFSMLAAAVVALLFVPLRTRLTALSARLLQEDERDSPSEVLRAFSSRLTLPIPLEELLLQLCESLRATLWLDSAEVWTGSAGILERAASDPDVGPASLILTPAERSVVTRAGVAGHAWLSTWLPALVADRGENVRMAPITQSGELLGLILVERSPAAEPLHADDDQVLATLARQVGLALKNVRLGSALEASLDELRESRARVVAAADAERRRIERDLHDGAQQHLLALAVRLRTARELAITDPPRAQALLEELTGEVRTALEDVRDLARGIYPPLLAARGLREGLREATLRLPVPARIEADAIGRYPPEVEATVYFCCVEALQNVGKHAGGGARATVTVREEPDGLMFEVADDGAGFDSRTRRSGAGLTNMGDRLGALGGRLSVASTPGRGTRVIGALPLATRRSAPPGTAAPP
jgi:signal transduction histidine kinase